MSKRLTFWASVVLVSLMAAAPTVDACSTSEYKTITMQHSVGSSSPYSVQYAIHFSFEYPSGYKRISTYAKSNPGAPFSVRFARGTGALGCVQRTDTVFGVNVNWPYSEARNAREAADRTVTGLGTPELVSQRSFTMVAGIAADLLVFRDPRMPDTPEERAVFFDFDGRIWNVFIYSDTARAEQAELDFEHMLETFKILP